MPKVITLSGLERTESIKSTCTPVRAHLPELGRTVTLCKESLPKDVVEDGMSGMRKNRGRPRGSTTRRGAKSPWMKKTCSRAEWRVDRKGKRRCQCTDSNMHAFQQSEVCNRKRRATPVSEGD